MANAFFLDDKPCKTIAELRGSQQSFTPVDDSSNGFQLIAAMSGMS